MNRLHNAIFAIAIISTIAFVVVFFVFISLLSKGIIGWDIFLSTIISGIIELILLYGLNSAISRIEDLEKEVKNIKKSIEKKDDKKTKNNDDNYDYDIDIPDNSDVSMYDNTHTFNQ